MPFSHHSHSGQFCCHAKNTLEEMVKTAIAKRFHTFALTEHMPRAKEDYYPEEETFYDEKGLAKLSEDFVVEAIRLRDLYSAEINIPIGFETEWIRPETLGLIREFSERHPFDFFLGSVHHVHTIPIDFDKPTYNLAREKAGGTDERLFEDYFDSQYEMLQALQPPVVGHLDVIRLLSDEPNNEFRGYQDVWRKIRRNLEYIASYGGILELNSSALRKNLAQPYPCKPICEMFLSLRGRFTMSDDSHSVDQVGTNYPRLLSFMQETGIREIYYATKDAARVENHPSIFEAITLEELSQLPFWKADR